MGIADCIAPLVTVHKLESDFSFDAEEEEEKDIVGELLPSPTRKGTKLSSRSAPNQKRMNQRNQRVPIVAIQDTVTAVAIPSAPNMAPSIQCDVLPPAPMSAPQFCTLSLSQGHSVSVIVPEDPDQLNEAMSQCNAVLKLCRSADQCGHQLSLSQLGLVYISNFEL